MSVQFFDIGGAEVAICSGPPMRAGELFPGWTYAEVDE